MDAIGIALIGAIFLIALSGFISDGFEGRMASSLRRSLADCQPRYQYPSYTVYVMASRSVTCAYCGNTVCTCGATSYPDVRNNTWVLEFTMKHKPTKYEVKEEAEARLGYALPEHKVLLVGGRCYVVPPREN